MAAELERGTSLRQAGFTPSWATSGGGTPRDRDRTMQGSGQIGGDSDSATRERPPFGTIEPAPQPGSAAAAGRPPSWLIGLSALLVAVGATGRGSPVPMGVRDDRRQPEAGLVGTAQKPADISARGRPARGWKSVLKGVYDAIWRERILLVAGGVTFYALLAIFPGIAALVSVYGLFANPSSMAGHLDAISSFAPGGAVDVIRDQLTRLTAKGSTALGLGFVISLAISLWTATSGVKGVFDALNVVYDEDEKRSFLKYNAIALLFTIAGLVFIVLALAILIVLPIALNYLPQARVMGVLAEILRWPILFVLVAFALSVLYRFGPSRTDPHWRWITWGSMFATVAWLVVSALFSWYAANFGSYNKTYGSLGAIVGFMTWVWLSTVVVLIGAKLDAELERRSDRKDTATPPLAAGAARA